MKLSIKQKLLGVNLLVALGTCVSLLLAMVHAYDTALANEKAMLQRVVESAVSVIETHQKSGLSEADAKAAAVAAIKNMRYAQKEYFWIQDQAKPVPAMVMHPTVPALDGKTLDADKFNSATSLESDGVVTPTDGKMNIFVAFRDVAEKTGKGFVTYNWPKPKPEGGVTAETCECSHD